MSRAGGPRWDAMRRIDLSRPVQPTLVNRWIYGDVGVLIRREENDDRSRHERIDGDVVIPCRSAQKYIERRSRWSIVNEVTDVGAGFDETLVR